MEITKNVQYVGVDDKKIDLFEGMYSVPNGMSYNSYVILDEKIAVIDTVDACFKDEWLEKIEKVLDGRTPDYLIVQHMEPDHSANVLAFVNAYPNVTIVSSQKAFLMMKNYFGTEFQDNRLVVGDGDTLSLGERELVFISAPMVHWPEVIVTYDKKDKILFSADGFGKFGALDVQDEWACEARRYYIGIVGKYGVQVQNLLKKLSTYEIQTICPLHGPVLKENLGYYLNLYSIWSSYGVETEGVMIAYTSVYGNTKKAVELLERELKKNGCEKVVVNDLARVDMAEAVEDAFRYGKIVFATTTYNAEIFPFMREFISNLTERNFQNKTVAFIENGSWAPTATKVMKGLLEKCKNLNYAQTDVKILSALNDESRGQVSKLAKELCELC
ncbi:MAG: FprA family A-type flavoprotein [Clostridiales bacterium]|nr:FprA family A-type flavoprotein [Clostridiales bacterium]